MQHVDELYEIGSGVDNLTPIKDSRDIPGHVWRSCFYKQISEFRGALKRHTANLVAVQSADRRTSLGSDAGAVQREQMHIARLTQGLLSFLSDSINYFQRIVHEVSKCRWLPMSGLRLYLLYWALWVSAGREGTDRFGARGGVAAALQREHGVSLPAVPGGPVQVRSILCPISSLRYLPLITVLSHGPGHGRYREMYSERTQKDFSQAMRYYERAALLEPGSGNAQNQVGRSVCICSGAKACVFC